MLCQLQSPQGIELFFKEDILKQSYPVIHWREVAEAWGPKKKSSKNMHGFFDKSLKLNWKTEVDLGQSGEALGRDFVTQTAAPP